MSSIELVYFINTEKNLAKPTFRLVENKLVTLFSLATKIDPK